jgi:hypothetical protein
MAGDVESQHFLASFRANQSGTPWKRMGGGRLPAASIANGRTSRRDPSRRAFLPWRRRHGHQLRAGAFGASIAPA